MYLWNSFGTKIRAFCLFSPLFHKISLLRWCNWQRLESRGLVMETQNELQAVQGGWKALLGAHILEQYVQRCCTYNWKLFLFCFLFSFPYFLEHRKVARMGSAWILVCAVCTIPGCALGSLSCVVGLVWFFWLACLNSSGFGTALERIALTFCSAVVQLHRVLYRRCSSF